MYGYGNSMFLATHGILARTASGGGVDPDAQAFITAASITDPTQQSAINQLVVDLKGYGIWTKMKALYPFVGGTAAQHKWNLKDPRDLDAAFRLQFLGGWTHSVNGATPNGTNAYADTKLIPSTSLATNSAHFSKYNRTNDLAGIKADGAISGVNASFFQQNFTSANGIIGEISSLVSYTPTDTRGLITTTRTANNIVKVFRNSTQQGSTNTATITAIPINNLYIGARNSSGTATDFYNTYQCAFASIGDGLTDTEAANFYTAVQAFQTTLGRSIGTQTVSDADAQAFVTNAGIVDQVEANAINNLVIGLKADGLWTKMKAVYPMVGGSNTSTSYNLRNTAQYQISWAGSVTWNSNGVTFGINGYGNTNFLDSNLTIGSGAMGGYSRTNNNVSAYDMGLYNSTLGKGSYMGFSRNAATFDVLFQSFGATTEGSASNTNGTGFYSAGKNAVNSLNGYKNGTSLISATKADTTAVGQNIYIGTLNNNNSPAFGYSQRNWAFAFISDGLNATENSNLNTRVTTFQTTLNRL